jgi:hypothetical protein
MRHGPKMGAALPFHQGAMAYEALEKEVEAIHARAMERVAHEAIEPEQFQVVSQVVAEVRQVIDKHRIARR